MLIYTIQNKHIINYNKDEIYTITNCLSFEQEENKKKENKKIEKKNNSKIFLNTTNNL